MAQQTEKQENYYGNINRYEAISKIAAGRDGNKAYFGSVSVDWKVIDFLKELPPAPPTLQSLFEGKTNGEVILMMYPNADIYTEPYDDKLLFVELGKSGKIYQKLHFWKEWWNAPYVIQTKEKAKKCTWIKYDYRTICPKKHDIDNPYWRIPEDRKDVLKFCPYCGLEIEIETEKEKIRYGNYNGSNPYDDSGWDGE